MLDLTTTINLWNKLRLEQPLSITNPPDELILATIVYLNAYRQTRLMLKNLAADQREWERERK